MLFNKKITTWEKILEIAVIVVVVVFILFPFFSFIFGLVSGFFLSLFY